MSARQKGEGWYADFMIRGTRYREFGFSSRLEAETWEANARLAIAKGHPLPSTLPEKKAAEYTLRQLTEYCARVHWSDKTSAEKLTRNAEIFGEFVGPDTPVRDGLTSPKIHDYVTHMKDAQKSGSTINRHLSSISVMVKYAKSLSLLNLEPLLPWQRNGESRERDFSTEQEREMFNLLRFWGKTRELALFEFLVDTGCRLGEALKASPETDLILDPPRIVFRRTKNGKTRTVPLTKRAFDAFTQGPGFEDINPWSLRVTWDKLRDHCEWIGMASIHTFRHTCACRLVQRGVDLYRVSMWLGHTSLRVTQIYARWSPKHLEGLVDVLETQ